MLLYLRYFCIFYIIIILNKYHAIISMNFRCISVSWNGRKQAWSADPTRRNWQFNRRNVKNCSLPGDVAYISGQPNDVQMNLEGQRLRDGHSYGHSRKSRINEQERMYMEDVEDQKARGYHTAELDSLQRHEMERGSDLQHQAYRQR